MTNQQPLKRTVYGPVNRAMRAWNLQDMLQDLLSARFLGLQLFKRDVRSMFRQSFFGILWAFIPPFFTSAVWIFINLFGFIQVNNTGANYPVFVMCGTIMFQSFFEALKISSDTVSGGLGMMRKLQFPREALLISAFYKLLFNFFLKLVALIAIALLLNNPFSVNSLSFLPMSLLGLFCGFSIGIVLIPFQLLYQDFGRILGIGSSVLMYLTPVVYPIPMDGIFRTLFLWNPITPLITVTRDLFMGNDPQMLSYFALIVVLSVPILWIGWAMFRVTMPIIVERSGS